MVVFLVGVVFVGMINGLGVVNIIEVVVSVSVGFLFVEVMFGLFMYMFFVVVVWYMVVVECGFWCCGFFSCVCCDDVLGEGLMIKNLLKLLRVVFLIKLYIIME